jgi:hypothetical protein
MPRKICSLVCSLNLGYIHAMPRFYQTLLILSTVAFSWLAMMAVHELGHVLHARLSGGCVSHVVLDPISFSRTDLSENPHPLFVAWGGVVWGIAIPLIVWLVFRPLVPCFAYLAKFFAGFCLIANGAYLVGGIFLAHGGGDDAGVILHHGGAIWQLLSYSLPVLASGLWLWNGLGRHFGLRQSPPEIDHLAAWTMTFLTIFIIITEWVICGNKP